MSTEKTDIEKVAKAALQATFTLKIVNAYANGFTEPKYNVFVTGRRGVIK